MGSVSSCCQSNDKDEEERPFASESIGANSNYGSGVGYNDYGSGGPGHNVIVNGGGCHGGTGRNQRPDLLDHSQGQHSGQYGPYDLGSGGPRFEQNNALNRVLHQMASNVIDVNMIDATPIEQQEWFERQRSYQQRINQIRTPLLLKTSQLRKQRQQPQTGASRPNSKRPGARDQSSLKEQQSSLPAGTMLDSQLQKSLLNMSPISESDIKLIEEYSDRTVEAMKSFNVISDEPLVVQFSP